MLFYFEYFSISFLWEADIMYGIKNIGLTEVSDKSNAQNSRILKTVFDLFFVLQWVEEGIFRILRFESQKRIFTFIHVYFLRTEANFLRNFFRKFEIRSEILRLFFF